MDDLDRLTFHQGSLHCLEKAVNNLGTAAARVTELVGNRLGQFFSGQILLFHFLYLSEAPMEFLCQSIDDFLVSLFDVFFG